MTIPPTITGLPVTRIESNAFNGCFSLTSVAIPDSVTSIGDAAFGNCYNLSEITVDVNNSVYSSVDGVLFNHSQTTLIACPGGKDGSYIVPDSVTNIGDDAFDWCMSLTSVTMPDSVTNIDEYAFFGCTSLTNITIPNSVTSIGVWALDFCISLTDVTIPDSVTNIDDYVFFGCSSLTSVTIPNSVTSIGNDAFWGCANLTNVTIPDSVTSLGQLAFGSCTNLTGVYFQGNAPGDGSDTFEFYGDSNATIYYSPGTTGWGTTFDGRPTQQAVATPTITPDGGDFADLVKVTLKCATPKAAIYYTADGSEPTSGSPKYKKPITLTQSATVKAVAFVNGTGPSATATVSFTISTPSITTASELPSGSVSNAYTVAFQATGGTAPYKWSLAKGSKLPAGLKLNATTGVLAGKPTKSGTFNFTVKVTDAKKQPDIRSLTLTIGN